MPQSSDEMYEIMKLLFGSETGIEDGPPMKFLEQRGYVLTPRWTWKKPKPDHWVTIKEELAIRFLIEEWDFDGIEKIGEENAGPKL